MQVKLVDHLSEAFLSRRAPAELRAGGVLLDFSEMICSTASCRCTLSPALPGAGSTFVPSPRMAQLLQMKAKQFAGQGKVRVLVIATDSTLWGELGA